MPEIIIFCQAPRDLTKVISLYEENRGKKITIFIVNVYSNYKFLKSFNLDAKLFFIPHKGIKNPINLLYMIIYLRFYVFPLINEYKGGKVYFFSQFFDYMTAALIKRLSRHNEILFCDIYKPNLISTKTSFKEKLVLLVFRTFITEMRYTNIGSTRAYYFELPAATKNIEIETNISHIYKKSFVQPKGKSILLFEGRGDIQEYFSNYINEFKKMISLVPKDYCIYIKPHPRLGHSPFIDSYQNIEILDKDIPSEFINEESFSLILGIETTATADFFNKTTPTYSLIPLFSYNDDMENFLSDYLNKVTNNKAKFINSYNEFSKMLSSL